MLAETNWQPWAMVLGLGILTLTMLRMSYKRRRQGAANPIRVVRTTPEAEQGLRTSMERLLVELQEVSREINAQLDTKMRALTQLTEEARRVLERESVEVETGHGRVRVKVGRLDGRVTSAAPEYEDCRRIAEAAGLPLKAVCDAAMDAFRRRV